MRRLQRITTQLGQPTNQNYERMKYILSSGLYTMEPKIKNITKSHLAILSTPGVAHVCNRISDKVQEANKLTIRGNSIALVSRGHLLNANGRQVLPLMDWIVAQIKFFANVDCYPFVIREESPLQDVFSDLSNSYSGALFLDDEQIPSNIQTSLNFFVLSHQKVCYHKECSLTDAQASSYVLAHLIKKQFDGIPTQLNLLRYINQGSQYLNENFIDYTKLNQYNIAQECPIKIHEILQGKICISLKFGNIQRLKSYFTKENFIRLFSQKYQQECVSSKLNAIVTDGTSVLGLGNIGPIPGLPVMQAKSLMFKMLGDVNVVPVCINPRKTPAQAIQAILDLIHLYKAINLQDFKSPECFTIERGLQQLNILPVFNDDQHGTSIAALAAVINALKIVNKPFNETKIVINGAGAAGINIAKIMYNYGNRGIIVCDTKGIIYKGRQQNMNPYKQELSQITNILCKKGTLQDAIKGADIFIGVSTKNTFKKEWIKSMNSMPIIFALANPIPEISQQEAVEGGCEIYGSGKNNKPNQISNSLVYPGIFRAINEHHIRKITPEMQILAAEQIAKVKGNNISQWDILPTSLNRNISIYISKKLGQCM